MNYVTLLLLLALLLLTPLAFLTLYLMNKKSQQVLQQTINQFLATQSMMVNHMRSMDPMTLAQLQTLTAVPQVPYPFNEVPMDDAAELERWEELKREANPDISEEDLKRDYSDAGWS